MSYMLRNGGVRLGRKSDGKKRRDLPPTLDPGEMICNKCNGTGWLTGKNEWEYTCDKCRGDGKVDWISNIMGKPVPPPRTLKGNWTIETHKDLESMYGVNLEQEMIDYLTMETAKDIDQEIIGNIVNFSVTKSKLK